MFFCFVYIYINIYFSFSFFEINHATSLNLYRSYYPHRSRELVSPVCGISIFTQYFFCNSFRHCLHMASIWPFWLHISTMALYGHHGSRWPLWLHKVIMPPHGQYDSIRPLWLHIHIKATMARYGYYGFTVKIKACKITGNLCWAGVLLTPR